jgi:hypothetical protein
VAVAEDDRSHVPDNEVKEQRRILPRTDAVERREIQQRQQYRTPERKRSDTYECHGPDPASRKHERIEVLTEVCQSQSVGVAPVRERKAITA